jgi:two-component sensor histidine kinase
LQTTLSAAQLKEIDFVPMVVNWAHAMGLSKSGGGTFFLVVTELFINALEHGVLGLSSSLKEGADGFERYIEARQQRLQNLQKGQISFALSYRH